MVGNCKGGSRKRSGGSGGGVEVFNCDEVSFEVPLNSPVEEVLSKLKKGDCLEVVLVTTEGKKVVAARWLGQQAGTITASSLQNIIHCLGKGKRFSALVLEVAKGLCRVHVFSGDCQ